MKINNAISVSAARSVSANYIGAGARADSGQVVNSDRISVSSLAKLSAKALAAYEQAEKPRPEAVAHARQALADWQGMSPAQLERVAADLLKD